MAMPDALTRTKLLISAKLSRMPQDASTRLSAPFTLAAICEARASLSGPEKGHYRSIASLVSKLNVVAAQYL